MAAPLHPPSERPAAPGGAPPAEPVARRDRLLHRILALDLRSLALLRVGLALVLIGDLVDRSRALTAHYTDAGVLPRADAVALAPSRWYWSIHLVAGSFASQAILFAIAGAFALLLLVGWRTRLATIVSWLLLCSLHGRNHLVLQGGDVLLRCVLFWTMFLPLGAEWSLDRARRPDGSVALPRTVLSMATVAFLVQLALLYVCSGLLKNDPAWTTDFTAGEQALRIEQMATPFGHWLLGYPGPLKAATATVLWFERLAPLLLLLPLTSVRIATVVAFLGAHLAMWACLDLGPFPFVAAAAWLAVVPSAVWDRLLGRLRARNRGVRIWYDGGCAGCRLLVRVVEVLLVPGMRTSPAAEDPGVEAEMRRRGSWLLESPDGSRLAGSAAALAVLGRSPLLWPVAWLGARFRAASERTYGWGASQRHRVDRAAGFLSPRPLRWYGSSRAANAACAYFLFLVVLWNWRTVAWAERDRAAREGHPVAGAPLAERLLPVDDNWLLEVPRLDQCWSMFAPRPLVEDGWYQMPAVLRDGSRVDLVDGGPVRDEKPERIAERYDGERWRKYLMNLYLGPNAGACPRFGRWVAADWDARHPPEQRVDSFEVAFLVAPTLARDRTLPRRIVLFKRDGEVVE